MDKEASLGKATLQSNPNNHPANLATASIIIGFGTGRTFIFYDHSEEVFTNWKSIFKHETCWAYDQFKEHKKPLGWITKLSMNKCANLEGEKIDELVTAFNESFGAELKPESLEATFFTPGVGVLRLQLSFAACEDVALRLNDLSTKKNRATIRPLLHDLVGAAAKCYTDCLDRAVEHMRTNKRESPIREFKAVGRRKPGYPAFYVLSFVNRPTFEVRTRAIRDLLAITDKQKEIFDERAQVGYEGASVFIDWSEALVTGNSQEEKQEIETNFIIAMASWSSLSLMERHSSRDIFDAFAHIVGANTKLSSVNDIYVRSMAYRDVSDASLPIRWTANSRDLHLLEAIHRNWSSDRLRQVIGERMQALALHHQRIQHEQREWFNTRQLRLNQRLTLFGIIVAISTLASAAASVLTLGRTSGRRDVILSLVVPVLVGMIFLIILWSKRARGSDASVDDAR